MIELNGMLSNVILFIFFFLPGFVSLKIWSLFHRKVEAGQHTLIYNCIFYSILNFALLSPLTIPFFVHVNSREHPIFVGVFILFYCLLAPCAWPLIWRFFINKKLFYKFLQLPYPTAWDYFVEKRKSCFVLIHLNDDNMIGGYYGQESYASTSPDEPSIYLEKVFKIQSDGAFGQEITDSFGMVISKNDYKYMEFFYESKE